MKHAEQAECMIALAVDSDTSRPLVRRLLAILTRTARDPRVRQWLLWCLPGLALALLLRMVITIALPWGIFHDDTPDFLHTADRLLLHHRWALNPKRTFLVPALYAIPFLLRVPALFLIPLAQHILGIGSVLMGGALCRLWFTRWKIWIVPVTLLLAANPGMLWYEHTLIAESIYLFTTLLVIVAATLYAKVRTRNRFTFLCVCLVLEAGARPEGKLFFGFALVLLCLLHFRELRLFWKRLALLAALGVAVHFITPTSQAGLLLYTSVARFTPPDLKCAPGFDAYIAPIRADLNQRWEERRGMPRVSDRRLISKTVADYLRHHRKTDSGRKNVNKQCMKMAGEICRRFPQTLPGLLIAKFRYAACEPVSGDFSERWLINQQSDSVDSSYDKMQVLDWRLTWEQFESKQARLAFIDQHYTPQNWFNRWCHLWMHISNAVRLPDLKPKHALEFRLHNIPVYFLVAAAGILIAFFRRREQLQFFHIAWGSFVIALFAVIILTANTKPRFRFVFEPLWCIYAAMFFDSILGLLGWLRTVSGSVSAPPTEIIEAPSGSDGARNNPDRSTQ